MRRIHRVLLGAVVWSYLGLATACGSDGVDLGNSDHPDSGNTGTTGGGMGGSGAATTGTAGGTTGSGTTSTSVATSTTGGAGAPVGTGVTTTGAGGTGGGSGGAGGGGGRDAGSGGAAGFPPFPDAGTCAQLNTDYSNAMAEAVRCDLRVGALQCQAMASSGLACGCPRHVQDATKLEEIRSQWTAAGCVSGRIGCPAIVCPALTSGMCVPNDGGSTGTCAGNGIF